MTRIRTLDFLPQIFQTETNSQFLGATLDQLVNPPVTKKIQGFIGSKVGYGIDAKDYYVTEPTKSRRDYQLEPGVVFVKNNETTAKDFISYPGILDSLKLQGAITDNNNSLFNSQFYSWDSFTNLDKIINYNQYYWLPIGPPAVTVSASIVYNKNDFTVTPLSDAYNIKAIGSSQGQDNPTLTLLRGGTYNFIVEDDAQFWIQGEPGLSGYSATQDNLYVRNVYGVTNNGTVSGNIVTFTVPQKDAQNEYNLPGNNTVGVVTSKTYAQLLGTSTTEGVDGLTALNNRTVMFYNTGDNNETVTIGPTTYKVSDYFWRITVGPDRTITQLTPLTLIPVNQKITVLYGNAYAGLTFFKNGLGIITQIPYLSAALDTLYYQDGVNANRVGMIQLIESNETNTIDVDNDILGKKNYTSKNGVAFTNGLKVKFSGDVIPVSYLLGEYYVEGVGSTAGIQLVPVDSLVVPEPFTTKTSSPYDVLNYDIGPYDEGLNIPSTPDYVTIARNSINLNAWSRSNRWFHIDVINATAEYNDNPQIAVDFATPENKAKRPIIEFYPNLKLFNLGNVGKANIDFLDNRTTNAFEYVENQQIYYPDVQTYTTYTGTVNSNSTPINLGSILKDQWYQIDSIGTTQSDTWVQLGATYDVDSEFVTGNDYIIYNLGTTTQSDWNIIAGTNVVYPSALVNGVWYEITKVGDTNWASVGLVGLPVIGAQFIATGTGSGSGIAKRVVTVGKSPYSNGDVFTCGATRGATIGTGSALQTLFKSVQTGYASTSFIHGYPYTIAELGNTLWTLIGASVSPTVGETFTATSPSTIAGQVITVYGTGLAVQGTGQVLQKSTTTISIDADEVVDGTFSQGQWINDLVLGQTSALPVETRILSIDTTDPTYNMTVYWPIPSAAIPNRTLASFVASTKDNTDLSLFSGARVVFANDDNLQVRNKIYIAEVNYTGSQSYPVITLTEAVDSPVLYEDQFSIMNGFEYKGKTVYFNGEYYSGTVPSFPEAQQKTAVNQAPRFDLFDNNGISYGDTNIYQSSTFNGCKLFNYKLGVGINDSILGFPISYSSINNVGDIRFEISLYTQTFDYIQNGNSLTSNVSDGFVYNYASRTEYERLLGWQTAVAPSTQYQIFQFKYTANVPPTILNVGEVIQYVVTVDVPQLNVSETIWPSLQVYNNNNILSLGTDYTVVNNSDSTVITINLQEDVDTPIEVLILSDKVSTEAYYSIPINLKNNPFNGNPTSVDIGDIRGQYQSIFENNPDTTGQMFGPNNYRDLGNVVPWGTAIIQNSASLVLPGAFLRDPQYNLYDALLFNSREYIKFKNLLIDTVNQLAAQQKFDPPALLDAAIDIITSVKSKEQPFFWSDMIPNKAPYISNTYSFANQAETAVFPLSKIYDFSTANYDGVLVYLQRTVEGLVVTKQLLRGTEYIVNTDSPSVTVNIFLQTNDKIIVKEYNQTYGSYVPNTPTKLGLYPLYEPKVLVDDTYFEPTYFIQGHDGSYNKLYGDYDAIIGLPVDFRDQALLEYETRVYNNIKLSRSLPIDLALIVPGYFRSTALTYLEWTEVYSKNFLDWAGQNRLDYKTQLYRANDPYSYNYKESTLKLDNSLVLQGNWRGIYQYVYDTSTPNLTPWAMIGYANKPDWWETRYGPAPYTNQNLILWTDLQDGIDYNNGTPVVRPLYSRPGLLDIIPVDDQGNLKEPLDTLIANYNQLTFKRNWMVGDDAPVEYSYRKSSTYPYDLMRLQALLVPADFYNLGVDLDNYKYNAEFNQFLVDGRNHLVPADIQIYGNGIPKTSYINWIVDYEKQLGINATDNIKNLLTNLDVRLVHRLAGFSDKTLLRFFVEKGNPDAQNSSLMIPDESYQVLLYENVPSTKLVYSGVVVQKTVEGYSVFGNSQTSAFFRTLRPVLNGPKDKISVQDVSVTVARDHYEKEVIVPYGNIFYNLVDVAQFLIDYGAWLISRGAVFDDQIQDISVNWTQMVAEFLYWTQIGFGTGSVITLNPSAKSLTIDKEDHVVQPLTYNQSNFVLNNNLYPIQNKDLAIGRDQTKFYIKPLNEGDAIAYGQFNLSNIEHGIVFNNKTLFNDTIYNLISGLKQNRIYTRGTKSAEWNGTMFASGFIYNQDNIQNWSSDVKYTQGAIVRYKNQYFTALEIVQPNKTFNQNQWKITNYDEIQKGLLPNSSTRSYESTLYYNSDQANLENDADLLSFSLIGFRPRDYMASADLTDITQVNVYKNLIKEKGTLNAVKAFKGANLPQGGIDYDVYENWAILQGTFGGTLNNNFIEFKLNESKLTGNPGIIGLTDGNEVPGAQELMPIYSLYNYGRPINTPYVLPTLPADSPDSVYPNAGYVNINDVKLSAYFYSNLPSGVDKNGIIVPLNQLYVNDYVWLADYKSSWQILTPNSIGQIVQVRSNLNGTCTVTFKENHNLSQYDIFSIINFDSSVNGYFAATTIVNTKQVLIQLTLPGSTKVLTGQGIGLKFNSQRVAQPGDIQTLPLINTEFVKNKVWVDTNTDGGWAVYRKSINYQYDTEYYNTSAVNFGSAVAYDANLGYLMSDAPAGNVYRYTYNVITKEYDNTSTLTGSASFGTAIVHENNIYAISQPTTSPSVKVYALNNTNEGSNLDLYQIINVADNVATTGSTNFGSALALSGDTNWLYISDYNENTPARNKVHAFRKRNISTTAGSFVVGKTYQITSVGTTNFKAIGAVANEVGVYFVATGVGAGTGVATRCDYQYMATMTNSATSKDRYGYSITTNYYGTTVAVGAPYVDDGSIENVGRAYVYDRLVQNIEINQAYSSTTPATFTLIWSPDPTLPLTVTKNGTLIDSSQYSVSGSTFTYSGEFDYGDILTIGGGQFVLVQTLTTETVSRIGTEFGYSTDTNTFGTEILVGAPYYLSSTNQEGGVFRYTYGGARFGTITGVIDTVVTSTRSILINGFMVDITPGDAENAANCINNSGIPNIAAGYSNGKLIISLANHDLASVNQELLISVYDPLALTQLGLQLYTQTQVIESPHPLGASQFGTTVKFNEQNSVAISAPVSDRYSQTTFDFTDDNINDNDTIFDNNSTQFLDTFDNAGAVYTYDYLGNYLESLDNIGNYTFAQSANAINLDYGSEPRYGISIDWHDNRIVVGAPYYKPTVQDGQVVVYTNISGLTNWQVYRQSNPVVDINKVENIQIFSAETNDTLMNLDYIDPLQGKILGAVRTNIDFVGNIDPASYNNTTSLTPKIVWGEKQIGSIWFDTSNIRYINYHQNDNVYNARYWGQLFPGSDVSVCTWVSSTVPPTDYQGPGVPKNVASFTVQTVINASNTIVPVYYFWVRNTGIIAPGKTLADINIANYISNPQGTGISYMAPLSTNVFAIYNCKNYINANDSVLHVGYTTGSENNPAHQQFDLIRSKYADDFLPGVPGTAGVIVPESLYDRMLDSLCGVDESGQVVPDPFLPKAVQSGVLARPRQSFFYDRYVALKNYLQYANTIMKLYPIAEIRTFDFLFESGNYYDTTDYWEYVNWWAVGYDDNTRSTLQVPIYADLSALEVISGTIVTVAQNGLGKSETYRYDGSGVWTRIGLQNGTIQFKSDLYDYATAGYGFGGTFYDTDSYDTYPSQPTRWILRALNEQIYTNELLINRNESLILLFEYIQEETVENQNYLPWLNKTSLVDVSHKIRELIPLQNYISDNQEFLSGYVNETKPYHVVIKEFLFDYTGNDVYPGTITDFDVPSQFDTNLNTFVSPQLVYKNAGSDYEFLPSATIWQSENYSNWFSNYGVSLTGENDYVMGQLMSYVTLSSTDIVVDNAQGYPVNGTIKIDDELITYSSVDRATGVLSGLIRGVNQTKVTVHIPGAQVSMDLPPLVVLYSGKNYSSPPRVLAYIDTSKYPEPRVQAELQVVMSLDKVTGINVINPGSGYAVTPEILIETALTYEFDGANVDVTTNTIELFAPALDTGDMIRYASGTDNIGGLADKEYYYINVLSNTPNTIIALYDSYLNAIEDKNRISLLSPGVGTQIITLGARALPISTSYPVRENNITIKFDRTTYDTQVSDWQPNTFYGSEFVGYYLDGSSSELSLAATQPDINTILSSAQGTVFPIVSVTNQTETVWASLIRIVGGITSNTDINLNTTSSPGDQYPSGGTTGMTVNMPVKFSRTDAGIVAGTIYYVKSIIDNDSFTISATVGGPTLSFTNGVLTNMNCEVAKVTDTAVVTANYPGIRTITGTNTTNNSITVPTSVLGSGGTAGLYLNVPVTFTGNVFGGLIANQVYYVVSVFSDTSFSVSESRDSAYVRVYSTDAFGNISVETTNGLSVGDPIVFDTMYINGAKVSSFGGIAEKTIYYIKTIGINIITISATPNGSALSTTTVVADSDTYCFITSQSLVTPLIAITGQNATMNISLPVSPGQVNGQKFTFYVSDIDLTTMDYYLKVTGANTFEVYSDPLLQIPVSGEGFIFGTGSFMVLPEPFVFTSSIVRYNNRVWQCVVSNNDSEFVFGNWELLGSGDSRLNALDRAQGYYQPTINMPGRDLTQLFTGLTYPNTTYRGNDFDINQQYPIDTQLIDTNFAATGVNIPAVAFDGSNYIAPANLPNYSGIIADIEVQNDWSLFKLANDTLAFTDIIKSGDNYVMTSSNKAIPLYVSTNQTVWRTDTYFVPYNTSIDVRDFYKIRMIEAEKSFNAVTEHNGLYIAVNNDIVYSTDLINWQSGLRVPIPTTILNDVAYVSASGFNGYVTVGSKLFGGAIYKSIDGLEWTELTSPINYGLNAVASAFNKIYAVGNGVRATSTDATNWTYTTVSGKVYNDVYYADDVLVLVGNQGFVQISTDGTSFTTIPTGTTENLNSVLYSVEKNQWTIVGNNNTVLQTNDITALTVTWGTTNIFQEVKTEYTVAGDPFVFGYGPEELVPGIVTDQLNMIVTTRAGTNWPASEYAHVGYNTVSLELDRNITNVYDFGSAVGIPAQVGVFLLVDGLSTTWYEDVDYSIDYINKTITPNTPLSVGQQLRVDVYEVGNGNQLVTSNTDSDPIELNDASGFSQIALDCLYTSLEYTGGGIVQPDSNGEFYTSPAIFRNGMLLTAGRSNFVLSTNGVSNTIQTISTQGLLPDQRIVFGDGIFGGITSHTDYYVDSVISDTSFSIKDDLGVTVTLTTASGSAIYVSNDYAAIIADNQINAILIFADIYDQETDYISYTIFGETEPVMYGYTIPQTQQFVGNGTVGPYDLTNYLGGDNAENAIVEVDGLRFSPSDYTVHYPSSTLVFDSFIPTSSNTIAVTTFNDTQRQYMFTNTYTGVQVTPISYVNNVDIPVTVQTSPINHNLSDNDVVRIEGVEGSIQLNGQLFTIKVLSPTEFALYEYIPYTPYTASVELTNVDTYIGGGYVSLQQSFVLKNKTVTSSTATHLSVSISSGLETGTPVYFTEAGIDIGTATSIPEIIAGQKYYIKSVNEFTDEFNISATRNGTALTLSVHSGLSINVTQWEQTNVDRLWVTVNGERVASSNLRLRDSNQVEILSTIQTTDIVVITSMMPNATPNQEVYMQVVDAMGQAAVYRANSQTSTWLSDTVGEYATTITVADASRLTDTKTQTSTTPASQFGYRIVPLYSNRLDTIQVKVHNVTTGLDIDPEYLILSSSGLGTNVAILDGNWISTGDTLYITILEGKFIYVNGEYMRILKVDEVENTINVQRGALGSIINPTIPRYTTVYSMLDRNKMTELDYKSTWNPIPGIYNTTLGDPLQIANTSGADFLKVDVT